MRKDSVQVQGINVPNQEKELIRLAIASSLKKTERFRCDKPTVRVDEVVAVLRSYSNKSGSACLADKVGFARQISRWLKLSVFPEFAMTHMGIMHQKDVSALQKENGRSYVTGRLSYVTRVQKQPQVAVQAVQVPSQVPSAPAPKKQSQAKQQMPASVAKRARSGQLPISFAT